MRLIKTILCTGLMLAMAGCWQHKRQQETPVRTYDQPSGPTSGLVKVIDTNTDESNVWWYWFEFIDNDHQVKEYRVCNTSDYIPKGLAGVISLSWSDTDNCFTISSFNRREDSEDNSNKGGNQ